MGRFNVDAQEETRHISQYLLKAKSRRHLDGILRKRILLDVIRGYGDELQYNEACRSHHPESSLLSSAVARLRLIKSKLREVQPGFVTQNLIFHSKGPTAIPSFSSKDANANFILESSQCGKGQLSNITRPPLIAFTTQNIVAKPVSDVLTKDIARSSITNALSNSFSFLNFQNKSDSREKNSVLSRCSQTRLEDVKETSQQKCVSSIYVPMLKKNQQPADRKSYDCNHISDASGAECKTNTHYVQLNQTNHLCKVENKPYRKPTVIQAPGNAGKFRIKNITIALNDNADGKRHYITGIKVHSSADSNRPNIVTKSERKSTETQAEHEKNMNGKKTINSATSGEPFAERDNGEFSQNVKLASIQGMTFSATSVLDESKGQRASQSCVRVPAYENRIKNKYSHPQKEPTSSDVASPETKSIKEELEEPKLVNGDSKLDVIPKFHFPEGKPRREDEFEIAEHHIKEIFNNLENGRIKLEDMGLVAKACGLSEYWKAALFNAAREDADSTDVSEEDVIRMWKRITSTCHDKASRFVSMLAKPGKKCLDFEDFLPLLKDIVDSHPGLVFLKDAAEFHTRYMNTVIARIFYVVNRSWSGQITANEIRKSNLLTVISLLEEEDDINVITDYFSYEHFYVIYCKFWELDTDHDLVIDKHDLLGYAEGVLSSRLIERVLSGAVTRWDTSDHQLGRMSYVDFVWFILSEEDKKSPTSIEYWFRCLDLDGDGYISMYEMEYFYEEQMTKLEQLDIEPLPFEDCICQILDIVNPSQPGKASLSDLKKCKMAYVFFDTFFNVAKYLNNEQKDPFVSYNPIDGPVMAMSDWETFAAEEYEMLVAEEQSSKMSNLDTILLDDYEDVDVLEETSPNSDLSFESRRRFKSEDLDDDINVEFTELTFCESQGASSTSSKIQTAALT